jgi:hypothetical protein
VAAELAGGLIRTHHHRQCIPANDRRDSLLEREVTRIRALLVEGIVFWYAE